MENKQCNIDFYKIENTEKINICKNKNLLIKLENLNKRYVVGNIVIDALKEISLDIYEGELLVIFGTSGSGKSTMLNILGGMDKATSGNIIINNKDFTNASENELTEYRRHEVGFVFQFYNLIPDLTVSENIALAADLAYNPMTVDEVLEEVGLKDKKNCFPAQLSGGEQQRISIARALVKRPSILLCDEPTGALDYETGKSILSLLENLARKNSSTVIIVTHNSAFGAIADRVIKLRSGSIHENIENEYYLPVERIEW